MIEIILTNQRGIVVRIHKSSTSPIRRYHLVYVTPVPFTIGREGAKDIKKVQGALHFDTQSNKMFVYDGNKWAPTTMPPATADLGEGDDLWEEYRTKHPLR